MDGPIKILVVEYQKARGDNLSLLLARVGFEVTARFECGEEAIEFLKENRVNIVLLEVCLKGKIDGIDTATEIRKSASVPIIYVTASADEATFIRANATGPAAFLSKPCDPRDLRHAILLALKDGPRDPAPRNDDLFLLSDRLFVRNRDKLLKIMMADVLYIEADRNYSRIYTLKKDLLLSIPLKAVEEKISVDTLVRIHRSYIVNLLQIEEIGDSFVTIAGKSVPLSPVLKEQLLRKIQIL